MKLMIASDTLNLVVQHLRAELPQEGCGLLATVDRGDQTRQVVRFYPGENIDHSPTRFTMNPDQVFAAMREIDAMGWSLGAIVHSHPLTPPTPSVTDLREAFYPDAWMMIVSFAEEEISVRVWEVTGTEADRQPTEVALAVHSG